MKESIFLGKIIEIAEEAGEVLLKFQKNVRELKKNRKDFLTDADFKSDKLVGARLKSVASQIPIFSEENGEHSINKGKIWVVDPLDGTVNFFHQDSLWGVSIALVENRKTKLGVVCLPALNQTIGVYENEIIVKGNVSLGVRKDSRLAEAQIWTDWGKESEVVLSLLPKLKKISLYPQIRLCATASLMAVANGKICAYIHPHPAPEDFAAAALIVEKVGGKVTDLNNDPWDVFSSSIIASNGILHEQILEGIGSI
ncbi:MAG: inositol monophosphatase [Candidatus Nealsonbacteria bacterium]|nr:inositol monophosphatase [Candidatus Nealsonbacteria bacterium]